MARRLRLALPVAALAAAAAFGSYWYRSTASAPLTHPVLSRTPEAPGPELIAREALQHRGTRYVWGGSSPGGFDCSGFVMYLCRKQLGVDLPRRASEQVAFGEPIPNRKLCPGDLLFFSTYRPGICHVGVYLGEERFIHAANRRTGVRIDRLDGYYGKRLRAARRLTAAMVTARHAESRRLANRSVPLRPS